MQSPLPSQSTGVKVAVAGPKTEHSSLCVDQLIRTGFDAIGVSDGDPKGLDCDLLILYGNCRRFHRYRRLLRRQSEVRPRVAVWQIDPLPPAEFDRRFEKHAIVELSASSRLAMLLRPIEMVANRLLCVAIARHGFGPYSDRTRGSGVDSTMARAALEAYGFIRNGFREKWIDDVFVSTIQKQEFLASRGIDSTFAPVGIYDTPDTDRNLERDIDVVFIGRLNKRSRWRRLARLRHEIEKRGAKMLVVENGCYGEERTALLNRTKIVLHVHKNPWDTPWIRWILAAQCGCLMVSEPLSVPRPFEPGVHYVEAPFEDLPASIEQLLARPADVLAMARGCADFIRANMRGDVSVETIAATAFRRKTAL